MRLRDTLLAVLAAAAILPALQGCRTIPATGGTTFTGGMTTAQEIQIGRENHPKIVKEFGGEYGTPELKAYVNSIGQLLAKTSERQDFAYTFTVLNSPIINAFATPGGYVYISRGLLALADNEAQLAGVLAHELGHITALHHARRYGQGVFANVLLTGAAILLGQVAPQASESIMQAGQIGAVYLLRSYSRENEFESDDLGVRYMSRAGYDPGAMAAFLRKLRADSQLTARLRGESPDKVDQFNYLATHPAPIERVRRAEARAQAANVRSPMTAQQIYFEKIDGILYGDDPDQGFVRGRTFLHPRLRFRFDVPEGFRLFNTQQAVVGLGPENSRIIFDRARDRGDRAMTDYLSNVWARNVGLSGVEAFTVNGLAAATGATRVRTQAGAMDARLIAVRFERETIYRFLFATPPQLTGRLSVPLRRTTYSFRRISEGEAAALKPYKLKIIRAAPGDSQERLARLMAVDDLRLERFRVLNGLEPGQELRPGQLVKIVSE